MLRKLLLAVLLLTLLATATVLLLLHSSLPQTAGKIRLAGPDQPISIHFDQLARPYVQAQSLEDALFAQGWLHGQNRLWQMELYRRAAQGRLAELLGESLLPADRELWRMGLPKIAQQLHDNSNSQALFQHYVDGINASIKEQPVPPPEFLLLAHKPRPWSVTDVYAVGALLALQSANNKDQEILRLQLQQHLSPPLFEIFLPDDGRIDNFPYVLPEPGTLAADKLHAARQQLAATDPLDNPLMPRLAFGSNGWVVAPHKTRHGHALFAFDSHDTLGLPNLFYEVHLFFADERQIRGWSVPGFPGVINGFNESIAWGFTNIGDTQDLYLETPDPEKPGHFIHDGTSYPAERETVSIAVRGRDQPVELLLTTTRNGPLIVEDPPLALRWTVQDLQGLGVDAVLEFNRARNWQEFSAALDRFAAPSLNATYGDVHGNIGFRTAGLLPRRARGQGLLPLPGDSSANAWAGYHPAEQLPRLYNPPQGFVAAANARVNAEGNGILVSADNAANYRIERLQGELSRRQDFTLEDMQHLQSDRFDSQARQLLPELLAALGSGANLRPVEKQALARLERWQAEPLADSDNAAALIFQLLYKALSREVFEATLGEALFEALCRENYVLNQALDRLILRDTSHPWWQGKRQSVIRQAFTRTIGELETQLGSDIDRWHLGTLHRLSLQHELSSALPGLGLLLDSSSYPVGGSTSTVGRASYRYDRDLSVQYGATVRVTGEMKSTPELSAVIPGGQSGHFLSPHYHDQLVLWLNGQHSPIAQNFPGQGQLELMPAK